jgi:hypothetical protein
MVGQLASATMGDSKAAKISEAESKENRVLLSFILCETSVYGFEG